MIIEYNRKSATLCNGTNKNLAKERLCKSHKLHKLSHGLSKNK